MVLRKPPPVTRMAAPLPELSMVSVLLPEIANPLALVKLSEPRLLLASRVMVLPKNTVLTPRVAVSPGLPGTLGLLLHLVASVQLPLASTIHVPTVPAAGTVIVP